MKVWSVSMKTCNYGKTVILFWKNKFFLLTFFPKVLTTNYRTRSLQSTFPWLFKWKDLRFDTEIFVFFRFSCRLSLEVFSFVNLFRFRTKKRYEIRQVTKRENQGSLNTFPHILSGDQFSGILPYFMLISDLTKIPRNIWLIIDQFHMSLMIFISETAYHKSVTKSSLRNNCLTFRRKAFEEPLTFVRIDWLGFVKLFWSHY